MHYDLAEEKMKEAIEFFRTELTKVRTGRANPKVLDPVRVDYYGTPTPLNQMSNISVVEGTQLMIQPFEPSMLKEVEKAVHEADLGLTPMNDGKAVRINIPPLTEEVRKDLVKEVTAKGEESKVTIRNARREANDGVQADASYTEDAEFSELERIQKLTDQYTAKIDELVKSKSEELMTV